MEDVPLSKLQEPLKSGGPAPAGGGGGDAKAGPAVVFTASPLMLLPPRAMVHVLVCLDATSLWAVSATCKYARQPVRLSRVCSEAELSAARRAVEAAAVSAAAAEALAAEARSAEPGDAVRTTARRFNNKSEAVARVRAADEAHARAAAAAAASATAAAIAARGAPPPMPFSEHASALLGDAICRKWCERRRVGGSYITGAPCVRGHVFVCVCVYVRACLLVGACVLIRPLCVCVCACVFVSGCLRVC